MSKKTLILILILASALLISAKPAARRLDVHIEVPKTIGVNAPFTASGPAVDAGIVCASGIEEDLEVEIIADRPRFRVLKALKRFTCDDGSGTFDVRMKIRLYNDNTTTARWRVVDGTGDYAGLKGNGTLVGTPLIPGTSILDVYDGKVK